MAAVNALVNAPAPMAEGDETGVIPPVAGG